MSHPRHLFSALLLVGALAVGTVAPAGGEDLPAASASAAGDDPRSVLVHVEEPADAPDVAAEAGAIDPDGGPVEEAEISELTVPADRIDDLEADPRVVAVLERGVRTVEPALVQSVPKVGAPARWSAGYRGAGKVVVVIDTGVVADFGGDLVGQACFAASEVGGGNLVGHCGPTGGEEAAFSQACFDLALCVAPGDVLDPAAGRPCPSGTAPCAHGSAVAATAARDGDSPGVAPDAGVYAIRVFNDNGSSADFVDLYLALVHAAQLADRGMDIAAVNLSVATSTRFAGACDSGSDGAAFRDIFAALAARGIAPVVASGNNGDANRIAFPACVSTAISVGASTTSDAMASFGNRGTNLTLLAPGAGRGGADLDIPQGAGSPFTEWSGTSFSTPHVAGAYALLAQEYPKATVAQRTWFLRSAGVPITDGSRTYRRLQLRPSTQVLPAQVLFPGAAPIAGTSRQAIGDVDGDGRGDVVAHGPGSAPDRIAYGRDDWGFDVRSHSISGSYTPIVGNFHGAVGSPDDILWYAPGSAGDFLWVGQTNRTFSSVAVTVNGSYTPMVGDVNGDGWDDIFWFAPGAGADVLWYGGATGFTSRTVTSVGPTRAAIGDFNGDGKDDIFLHGPGSRTDAIWLGTSTPGSLVRRNLSIGGTYTPIAANLTGSSADDVLLYAPGAAADFLWVGGVSVGSSTASRAGFGQLSTRVSGSYFPVVGDLDANGYDDIVWYAPGSAPDAVWFGRSTGLPISRSITASGIYRPLVGDVDGDDGDDIVWFSTSATTTPVWWSYVDAP